MDPIEQQIAQPKASLIPGVLSLVFHVPNSVLRQAMMPTPLVTTFGACLLPNKSRLDEFKDHVFVENEDAGNYQAFRFVPVRTDAQRETPIAALGTVDYVKHPWDDCLLLLGALEDPSQPINVVIDSAVVEVPRLFGRYYKLPGGLYASRVETHVFANHEPFPDEMKNDVLCPVPADIRWQSRNLTVNFTGLHDDIEFEETQTSGTVLNGWGTKNATITPQRTAFFPATNPPIWIPHYFSANESVVGGMRRLVKMHVSPPPGAEEILNASF